MTRDQKLELLHGVPLFAGLREHALERLGMLTDEVDLPAGRALMRQGERGEELFVLIEGRARIERDGHVIAEGGAGDFFGEISLVDGGPRSATVSLTEPSRLLVVGRRDFHSLMEEFPDVRLKILEALALRVRNLESGAFH